MKIKLINQNKFYIFSQEEYKQIIARTRSGRLSRPPKHIIHDYKKLANPEADAMQADIDDSDDYSDNSISNTIKPEPGVESSNSVELLKGLEPLKRKISDHFKCFTCNKTYLGKSRIAKHFEMYPEHSMPHYTSTEFSLEAESKVCKCSKLQFRYKTF